MPRGKKKKQISEPSVNDIDQENQIIIGDDTKKKKLPSKLQLAIKKIQKEYGDNSIGFANKEKLTITRIPSNIKSLDEALGGGFPRGMITEIFGSESGGKGTIVGKTIAALQKAGGLCHYVDAEHALEEKWMTQLGVDYEQMLHSVNTDVNKIFDIMKQLLTSNALDLLVVDSVAALTFPKEIEEEMGKASMASLAKQMNKGLRVSNSLNNRQGPAIIYINQVRDSMAMFGSPTTTPGGKGMRFFARVRVEVKRGEYYPNKKDAIGREIICRIVKNATAIPETEARFVLINKTGELKEWSELPKKIKEEEK
jgi:recombination protein RecA